MSQIFLAELSKNTSLTLKCSRFGPWNGFHSGLVSSASWCRSERWPQLVVSSPTKDPHDEKLDHLPSSPKLVFGCLWKIKMMNIKKIMSGILACTRSGLNKEAKPVKPIIKYHEAVPVIVGYTLIRIMDTDRVSYTSDLDGERPPWPFRDSWCLRFAHREDPEVTIFSGFQRKKGCQEREILSSLNIPSSNQTWQRKMNHL